MSSCKRLKTAIWTTSIPNLLTEILLNSKTEAGGRREEARTAKMNLILYSMLN